MAEEKFEKNKPDNANKDAAVQQDPETLNTTDPQEHMKGPISGLMHKMEEGFAKTKDVNENKNTEDAD